MDKDLELLLIEEGFNSTHKNISMRETSDIIASMIADTAQSGVSSLVLFEGLTYTIFNSGSHTSQVRSPVIAITGKKLEPDMNTNVLCIYSLQDLMENGTSPESSSANFQIKEGYFGDVEFSREDKLRVNIKSKNFPRRTTLHATFYAEQPKGGQVLCFRYAGHNIPQSKYFLEHIASLVGLDLIHKEIFAGVGPYFADGTIEQNGFKLNIKLLNPDFGYGYGTEVIIEFQNEKSNAELSELVKGLKVFPVKVDDCKCSYEYGNLLIPHGGKKFEVKAEHKQGKDVVVYLQRVLQMQS